MKKFIFASLFFMASASLAHVEEGIFQGTTPDGKTCAFESLGTSFEDNMHHPLNERVSVVYDGIQYVLSHPSQVDVKSATVSFNHDILQGVVATKTGAKALSVTMAHTPTMEGPVAFSVVEDVWTDGTKTLLTCENLVKLP